MRLLVTGGTGFIGSHLVDALLKRGDEVVCLTRRKVKANHPNVTCHLVDLADSYKLKGVLNDVGHCDYVFHFAATLPLTGIRPRSDLTPYLGTNISATALLIEAAIEWGVAGFIYASSLPIIGKPRILPVTEDHPIAPENAYLLSKYFGEWTCHLAQHLGVLPATCLRITSPYGPGMNQKTVLPMFVRSALASEDIRIYGTGQRTQNFVHVSDVVRAALLAMSECHPGTYNIGGPSSITMHELALAILRCIPLSKSEVIYSDCRDPQDDYRWEVSLERSGTVLKYRPEIDFPEGLADYISSVSQGAYTPLWCT